MIFLTLFSLFSFVFFNYYNSKSIPNNNRWILTKYLFILFKLWIFRKYLKPFIFLLGLSCVKIKIGSILILALLWNWMVLKILFLNSYSMSTLLLSLDLWRIILSRSIFILDLSIADLWVLFPRKILKLNSRFWELFILLNAISLDFAKPPFCNFSCTFTYPPSWSYFSGTFLIKLFFFTCWISVFLA